MITFLGLQPHPEGGYYRAVLGNENDETQAISSILYLLQGSDFSAFHRLHGLTEIWYHHTGATLKIFIIEADGRLTTHLISPTHEPQVIIQPDLWFAAELATPDGFCLVGCAVSPAFTYNHFELARKKDLLSHYPEHSEIINRLCRQ
ncbi:MAG: cupin domain-containing protein [Bacteroidales bacterium]|nr:cupin domain-containing protein [Bacteroidales bacterium]